MRTNGSLLGPLLCKQPVNRRSYLTGTGTANPTRVHDHSCASWGSRPNPMRVQCPSYTTGMWAVNPREFTTLPTRAEPCGPILREFDAIPTRAGVGHRSYARSLPFLRERGCGGKSYARSLPFLRERGGRSILREVTVIPTRVLPEQSILREFTVIPTRVCGPILREREAKLPILREFTINSARVCTSPILRDVAAIPTRCRGHPYASGCDTTNRSYAGVGWRRQSYAWLRPFLLTRWDNRSILCEVTVIPMRAGWNCQSCAMSRPLLCEGIGTVPSE